MKSILEFLGIRKKPNGFQKFDYTCEIIEAISNSNLTDEEKRNALNGVESLCWRNPHKFFSKENYEYILKKLNKVKPIENKDSKETKILSDVINEIKDNAKEDDVICVYFIKDNRCNFVSCCYKDTLENDTEKYKNCKVKHYDKLKIETHTELYIVTYTHCIEIEKEF